MEIVMLLMLLLIIAIVYLGSRYIDNSNPYPFNKKTAMYSTTERSFYQMLESAVGKEYKILSRVRLTDIVEPRDSTAAKTKRSALIKASAKTVDFVLCNKNSLSVVGVVDLVNNEGKNGHRAQKDWFVNGALEAAGVPHIRIKIKSGYKTEDIRNCIMFKLGKIKTIEKPSPIIRGTMGNSPFAHLKQSGLRDPELARSLH